MFVRIDVLRLILRCTVGITHALLGGDQGRLECSFFVLFRGLCNAGAMGFLFRRSKVLIALT